MLQHDVLYRTSVLGELSGIRQLGEGLSDFQKGILKQGEIHFKIHFKNSFSFQMSTGKKTGDSYNKNFISFEKPRVSYFLQFCFLLSQITDSVKNIFQAQKPRTLKSSQAQVLRCRKKYSLLIVNIFLKYRCYRLRFRLQYKS